MGLVGMGAGEDSREWCLVRLPRVAGPDPTGPDLCSKNLVGFDLEKITLMFDYGEENDCVFVWIPQKNRTDSIE